MPISSTICFLTCRFFRIHLEALFLQRIDRSGLVQVQVRFGSYGFLCSAFVLIFWLKQQRKEISKTSNYTARVPSRVRLNILDGKSPFTRLKIRSDCTTVRRTDRFQFKVVWPHKMALDGSNMHITWLRVVKAMFKTGRSINQQFVLKVKFF